MLLGPGGSLPNAGQIASLSLSLSLRDGEVGMVGSLPPYCKKMVHIFNLCLYLILGMFFVSVGVCMSMYLFALEDLLVFLFMLYRFSCKPVSLLFCRYVSVALYVNVCYSLCS